MTTRRWTLAAALVLAWAGFAPAAAVIHVSPDGDDAASGAEEAPIRTLGRLESLLRERDDVTEVVLQSGVYYGSIQIHGDGETPLLIRSAERHGAIFDGGGVFVEGATPVEGWPGTYVVEDPEPYLSDHPRAGRYPAMWDAEARYRYRLAADAESVKRFPGTYFFASDALYFHTPCASPPEELAIETGRPGVGQYGIEVFRDNVALRGLWARNYQARPQFSAAFCVRGDNATIEDCKATNSPRGFRAMSGSHNARFVGCEAYDVGGGILVNGRDVEVVDNLFVRGRGDFMIPMPLQEDTAVETYHPAGGRILIRGNKAFDFTNCGVFMKSGRGEYTVENNTLVGSRRVGIAWSPGWRNSNVSQPVVFRNNIIYGPGGGISQSGYSESWTAEGNCLWAPPWTGAGAKERNAEFLNRHGSGNFVADPRMAAPEAHDARLLPGSPCLDGGAEGGRVGAAGPVPEDYRDEHPPLVSLSEQPDLAPVPGRPGVFASRRPAFGLRVNAHDAFGEAERMRLRVDGGEWSEREYARDVRVELPGGDGLFGVGVQVADGAGNWSEPETVQVQVRAAALALEAEPTVRANRHGVSVAFEANGECLAYGEGAIEGRDAVALRPAGVLPGDVEPPAAAEEDGEEGGMAFDPEFAPGARRRHVLGAVFDAPAEPGTTLAYRLVLETPDGDETLTVEGRFEIEANAQEYWVAEDGEDAEGRGSQERPWATLQYAADRALPGDAVVLRPGVYSRRTVVNRGGAEGAPLTVRAERKWEAVVDGDRRFPNLIHIVDAPHFALEGLEMRWYGDPFGEGIRIEDSPHAAIRECKIWNGFWDMGRMVGLAFRAYDSPHFVLERSLLFRNDWTFILWRSPNSRIVSNTVRGHLHGGIQFYDGSLAGTVIVNNCLTYNGSYTYRIRVDPELNELETAQIDYNNLGTNLIDRWRDEPGVVPNLPRRTGRAKHLVVIRDPERQFISTFEDWQEYSGQEKNSIWADPKFRDVAAFDFRLMPDSPNIGAGKDGATIGAMPVYDPEEAGEATKD